MVMWQPLRGIKEPIPIRSFSGVYVPEDEGFNLPDGFITDMSNISGLSFPALSTRPGYTILGSALGGRVTGLGAWKDIELHAIANGVWQRWNGSAWVSLATGLSTTALASFVNFQGNLTAISLIMANGVDPVKYWDGTSVQNLLNAPAGGNYVEQHDNRLYLAVGNIVKFSALRKPQDWTTVNDAGEIVIESSDGELISALKSGPKHLIVFKPNSMYDLLGTGPSDYTLIPIANDIGAINNNCVVNIGGLAYFLHTTGIYSYASARPQKDFCKPVMPLIRRINLSAKDKCSMGTDGRSLYISIPLDSATEPNTILQYDLEHDTWYIWNGYAALNFAISDELMYIGNVDGTVRRVGGTSDNGSAITSTVITKPFTAASIARKQQWFKIWIVASIPTGSSLSVYVSGAASGENWTLAKTLTADSSLQYKMILIPTNSIANVNAVRLKIVATGTVQIHEITRQLREMPMR